MITTESYTIAYLRDEIGALIACVPDGTDIWSEIRAECGRAGIDVPEADEIEIVAGLHLTDDVTDDQDEWLDIAYSETGGLRAVDGRRYDNAVRPRAQVEEVEPT